MTGMARTVLFLASDGKALKEWKVRAALDELDAVDGARGLVHKWLVGIPLAPAERDYLARWCGLEDDHAAAQD